MTQIRDMNFVLEKIKSC